MQRARTALAAILAPVLVATTALAGCGDDGPAERASPEGGSGASEGGGTVEVLAAASLTDVFGQIATAFEEANPGTSVEIEFAGSSTLATTILEGRAADVFASANEAQMDKVAEEGLTAGEPEMLATNSLAIAVPPGNPAGIGGLEDFARDGLLLGLCAEEVPCGDFAREALANAGIEASIDTAEPDVRALLTKVEAGELDAGITYATDIAAGDVDPVPIAAARNVVATYPIATLAAGSAPDLAAELIAFVQGSQGRAILGDFGFGSSGP